MASDKKGHQKLCWTSLESVDMFISYYFCPEASVKKKKKKNLGHEYDLLLSHKSF